MALVYAASSAISAEASSTTVSATIPAEAIDGEFIVAYIMHRSALTTLSGWTLIATVANGDLGQSTSVLYKVASSDASTSPTWTQASSSRFVLGYHVFTGGGAPTLVSQEPLANISSYPWNIPNDGNLAADSLVLNAASVAYEQDGQEFVYSVNAWKTPVTQPNTENRLICAYSLANAGTFDWDECTFETSSTEAASTLTAVFTFANGVTVEDPNAFTGQQPSMVLADEDSNARAGSIFAMILWENPAGAVVAQSPVMILHRRFGRRVIANYY